MASDGTYAWPDQSEREVDTRQMIATSLIGSERNLYRRPSMNRGKRDIVNGSLESLRQLSSAVKDACALMGFEKV